jgi:hypothetical protein
LPVATSPLEPTESHRATITAAADQRTNPFRAIVGCRRDVAGAAILALETLGELPQAQLGDSLCTAAGILDPFRIAVMADQVHPLVASDCLAKGWG